MIDDTLNKTLFGLGTVSEAVQAELEGDKISKTKNKARRLLGDEHVLRGDALNATESRGWRLAVDVWRWSSRR